MDLSEALNFSVKKIVEQGSQCRTKNDCAYGFGSNGCAYGFGSKHCAIGWLLDDTNPKLMGFEGDVGELVDNFEEVIPMVIRNYEEVFAKLQVFHDYDIMVGRKNILNELIEAAPSVDYSGDHWEAWVNMGA